MKKVLAIVLAAVLVLSCSMTAFAVVKVNGVEQSPDATGVVTVDTANDVIANGTDVPANVKVTNNVLMTHTTDGTSSPVTAFSDANIEVGSGNQVMV